MQEEDRTSSGGLDLEVEEARTSQVPKLDQLAPAWCWRAGAPGQRRVDVQIRRKTCEAIFRIWSQGLGKSLYLRVTQTCPWTQFPGNRLILSRKVEKVSYYLTQPVEETPGDDRELSQKKLGWSRPPDPKFVCTVTFILFVYLRVCVRVCVLLRRCEWTRVLNLQYPSVREPLTVSKGRMRFTFFVHMYRSSNK